jgi:hypothetical protein
MKLVCPHCRVQEEYRPDQIHVFVKCHHCGRDFRPAESAPLIGGVRRSVDPLDHPKHGFAGSPLAPSEASDEWLVHSRRAGQLYRLRRYAEAERELRASLSLNPHQPKAQRLLRRIHALRSARP